MEIHLETVQQSFYNHEKKNFIHVIDQCFLFYGLCTKSSLFYYFDGIEKKEEYDYIK